jgi:hypothetical protein
MNWNRYGTLWSCITILALAWKNVSVNVSGLVCCFQLVFTNRKCILAQIGHHYVTLVEYAN